MSRSGSPVDGTFRVRLKSIGCAAAGFAVILAIAPVYGAGGFDGELSPFVDVYFNEATVQSSPERYQPRLELWLRGETDRASQLSFEADARFHADRQNDFYMVSPRDLHGSLKLGEGARLSVGRKHMSWSRVDEALQLGVVQARERWDYLRTRTLGLTGLFFEGETRLLDFQLFASPLFVPELSAPFRFENGQCQSRSAWFDCPASTVEFLPGQTSNLTYQLEIPSIARIVSQASLGGRVGYGNPNQGFRIDAGYLYKPVNQFLVGFQPEVAGPDVNVLIYPRIAHHHVVTTDARYSWARNELEASLLYEASAEDESVPEFRTTQRLQPATVFSLGIRSEVSRGFKLGARYFNRAGGEFEEVGDFQAKKGSFFESRYWLKEATRLEASYEFPWRLTLSASLTHDFYYQGSILSGKASYYPTRFLRIDLGADFLSVTEGSQNPVAGGSDLINRYRGNDRIYAGVSYVF